ncbi:MAG: DNA repair exonuclease [Eubacteriales bacterium]|nr:DNA repair exonuclease [Eubacteriales bacterium]
MGLKILHTADWHLDSPLTGFREDQRQLLRESLAAIPGHIADLCRRESCDMMLLAGDIFDGQPRRETVEGMKAALESTGVPVLIAPGNHDFAAPGSPWVEETWPENVFIFTGGMEIVPIPALDCRVYGAAFTSMDSPPLLEGFEISGPETYHIGLFHGDPVQKSSPCNPVTAAQVRRSELNYLALGHIHKAGAFRAGDTLCAWPGCPMGRGWDETGDKGVCIVTVGEKTDIRAVSLDVPRFHVMEVDVGEDAADALEAALPAAGDRDFYRVTLTGYGELDLEELQKRFAPWTNLELRSRVEPPMSLWDNAGEDSLEGVYFQMLHRMLERSPEEERIVLLAAEISRKLLQGREVTL